MLLRFAAANHRSIRDRQELLLSALRSRGDGLTFPVPAVDDAAVPVVALYGANAAGKSNLLDAMVTMRRLVEHSHKGRDGTDAIPRSPFLLDPRSPDESTRFECSFTLAPVSGDAQPVYDLEIEFTEREIRRERLRRSVLRGRRSTHTLYARETVKGSVKVTWGAQLQGENRVVARLTRPNSLFLSAAAQNNHPHLGAVHRWFCKDWSCLLSPAPATEDSIAEQLVASRHGDRLQELLGQAEAGIRGIEVGDRELDDRGTDVMRKVAAVVADQLSEEDVQAIAAESIALLRRRLRLLHDSANGPQPLNYESESRGTRMFLTLALPAIEALASGGLLVVDELDSSTHPGLAQAFVSLFRARESNPHGAQLVFSTHDVTLLGSECLHQDEIWLLDKDADGASSLTPLTDFRIRGDVERVYRECRLGGAPELNCFFVDWTS